MLPNGFFLDSMWEWMAWNTFLALIPYVLSRYLFGLKKSINTIWLIGFAIFVLFMPNAPYVVTDFMHLFFNEEIRQFDPALTVFVFFLFIATGIYLFASSYQRFELFFVKKWRLNSFTLRFISFVALSVGVYLGRFPRLNSWDIVRPLRLVNGSLEILSLHGLIYVSLFTLLLWLIYFLYTRIKK